ncbi:tripartite tricarboxylate transporter TctB family protein [Rhodovulum sp. YNF3179]|uniref:tripartite tricarboxylate transporter TctB family protein n=1 Tax=Rhodovulum sp. YNF3179 TaxID=3425127 RepID=UPI003D3329A0
MALDRWIALIFLIICLVYGYSAFMLMDAFLPPFMQRNPVWPSTFPKVLSVLGVVVSLVILTGIEKPGGAKEDSPTDINWRRLHEYELGQAIWLMVMMVAYALLLRPIGFLAATFLFLVLASALLGERRWITMLVASAVASGGVWYLVQEVLGIFLSPFPAFL